MFTSHKQISPPSLVLKLKISEVSQKWIPKAVELKRIPTHKKCKCKKFCSQTRLVGEIYSSDVIMHRGYYRCKSFIKLTPGHPGHPFHPSYPGHPCRLIHRGHLIHPFHPTYPSHPRIIVSQLVICTLFKTMIFQSNRPSYVSWGKLRMSNYNISFICFSL